MQQHVYQEMIQSQKTHWWYVGRRKILDKILSKLEIRGASLLEIGGGMGGNIDLLKAYGEVTVLDNNTIAISYLHEAFNVKVVKANFPEKSELYIPQFGCILMLDVLEHIEDDNLALTQLAKSMQKHAKLVITVPAYQFLCSHHDEVMHHYRRYSMSNITALAESNGFTIKYKSYFNTLLFPIALITRTISKLFDSIHRIEQNSEAGVINSMLTKLFSLESALLPRFSFPFGLSIVLVLEPKDD
ncbi:methyltransferase domain-containing protein [Vibrio sp. 10N.261.55.A7]|uniref:class I SAM-dependent methyltransferase n=1 Tax=Vibrio sp. 10N.261.55.A7 TaxID=1880851 RepID=UPI000C820D60|nr:methyltransferase domain-containing protein [Vibrio sp. 10N.261.55.A7]PMJ99272.1 hypothetical protein BCU12_21100 [Vibrio sp. 10N.261.55.A7]